MASDTLSGLLEAVKRLSPNLTKNANFAFLVEGGVALGILKSNLPWNFQIFIFVFGGVGGGGKVALVLCQFRVKWHFMALTFGTRSVQGASQYPLSGLITLLFTDYLGSFPRTALCRKKGCQAVEIR